MSVNSSLLSANLNRGLSRVHWCPIHAGFMAYMGKAEAGELWHVGAQCQSNSELQLVCSI